MSTITVPRPDVTTEQVADILSEELGSRYNVLAGAAVNLNPLGEPRPDHADRIVIGTGSNRLFRAQVTISHQPGDTTLHVTPGGLTALPRVTNRLWIARKVARALRAAPGLR